MSQTSIFDDKLKFDHRDDKSLDENKFLLLNSCWRQVTHEKSSFIEKFVRVMVINEFLHFMSINHWVLPSNTFTDEINSDSVINFSLKMVLIKLFKLVKGA